MPRICSDSARRYLEIFLLRCPRLDVDVLANDFLSFVGGRIYILNNKQYISWADLRFESACHKCVGQFPGAAPL